MPFALTVLGMLWGFHGMFRRAMDVFGDAHEDMSFGWYVPIFSAYILYAERDRLRKAIGAPSLWGLVASLPFLALALLGTRGIQLRFEQLGFIGLCVTIPWAFFGWRLARLCVFPAAYLLFTIPVSTFLDFFTVHLRLIASSTALGVLKGFGFNVVQQGTAIISQSGAHPFSIDVAEPCSGLRSFFALTALTAAYAYFSQRGWWRRLALFLCAGPLAVLGNVMRVITICLVAAYADPNFALGFYHDYSGYVVFVVAISLMVAAGEAITRIAPMVEVLFRGKGGYEAGSAAGQSGLPDESGYNRSYGFMNFVLPVFFLAVFVFQSLTPEGKVMEPPPVEFPDNVQGCVSDEVRYCHNDQCGGFFERSRMGADGRCPKCGGVVDYVSLGERRILPADTQFRRRVYHSAEGYTFLVSAVIGGIKKNSIHRPELCLPAQGFLLLHPQDFEVAGRTFHAVEAVPRNGQSGVLAYTFFNQSGFRTSSHVRRILQDVWDRSFHNRIDRWVMVTVHVDAPGGFTRRSPAMAAALNDFLGKISEVLP